MRRDHQVTLQDAIAAAEDILSMLGVMSEAHFVEDRRTRRAVERLFEIIGEALSRPSRDFPTIVEGIPEYRRAIVPA